MLQVAEDFTELCSVGWKVKFVCNKLAYLAEEISKPSVEGTSWFPFTPCSKILKGREKLERELLRKRNQNFNTWKILS